MLNDELNVDDDEERRYDEDEQVQGGSLNLREGTVAVLLFVLLQWTTTTRRGIPRAIHVSPGRLTNLSLTV